MKKILCKIDWNKLGMIMLLVFVLMLAFFMGYMLLCWFKYGCKGDAPSWVWWTWFDL